MKRRPIGQSAANQRPISGRPAPRGRLAPDGSATHALTIDS